MAGTLEGNVAVITGAASGIGAAAARLFVREGAKVLLADIQVESGNALAAELGEAAFVPTDVTQEADIARAFDRAVSRFGRLDCVVNNAGVVGPVGSIETARAEDWDRAVAILLRSVFFGAKHGARLMRPQRSGAILSLASVAGLMGGLGPHVYTAAKHGVIGLTRSVASELAQHNIRVNAVAPGPVATPMVARLSDGKVDTARARLAQSSPFGSAIEAEEIAGGLLYLASDAARHVTGHVLVIDGGMTSALPNLPFHSAQSAFIGAGGGAH